MHWIIKSTILLSVALMASIAHAALEVKLDNPKTTGNMTVIRLNLKNTGSDTIASVRASIYLLDAQGKMIGQSTRWILGGTKADMLPSRPESQRDSILQPGVGPQRGTTPGYMSAIVPTPTEISAKACSGGLRLPSVRGKPNEARRSQTAATTKTTFADISNGVVSTRQRNAATPLGLGRIFITIPRVVPRCGPTLG